MGQGRYGAGVRALCCREAADSDLRTAAEDPACVDQISRETVRQIVEAEGRRALGRRGSETLGPDEPTRIITGADGAMVPMVTKTEKREPRKRRTRRRTGRPRRRRMHPGSDLAPKESKIAAFHDPSKEHQCTLACRLQLDKADVASRVSGGAL